MNFHEIVKEGVERFNKIEGSIRVVTHLDADGISAGALIVKTLEKLGRKYTLSIEPFLDRKALEKISNEDYDLFIFTDLGSGNLDDINELIKKEVLILDHHKPKGESSRIIHVNPHLGGVDGSREISGSGVVYFFCKEIYERINEMSYLALIGAIGDVQENNGFSELNNLILNDAIGSGIIKVERGIKLFGFQTKPIHKLLEYCNNPTIPDITGNEKNAIQFLKDLGIYTNGYKRLTEINNNEMQKLVEGLSEKTGKSKEELLWNNYILVNEEELHLKELREFSTVLNACGRIGKGSVGIGACLNDKEMKKKAVKYLMDYKGEIVKTMDWFNENRNGKQIIEKERFIIINAKDKVMGTIIGTLASVLTKSSALGKKGLILAMARLDNGMTKVSLRSSLGELNLRDLLKLMIDKLGVGEFGGHKHAAGCLLPSSKEEEFILIAKDVLERKSMEEII